MTKRRGHGEGTLYQRKRDGMWIAEMSLGDGRRKAFTGKTRQEAQKKLSAAKRDRDQGLPIVRETQTVGQWITAWLDMQQPRVESSTLASYRTLLRHVSASLGKIALAKLTPVRVQALYAQLQDEGLSSSTVAILHTILHGCLDSAVRLELLARNIADQVDRPRTVRHEMAVLSEVQVRHLLDTAAMAQPGRLPLYTLAIATGMRQGELLALHWRDVDLGDGSLQVRGSLRRLHGVYTITKPKTRGSERRIALAGHVIETLRAHRLAQLKARHDLGPAWTDRDLVFPNEIGGELAADSVRHRFGQLLATADLPRMRFHDLRHTAATLLLGRRVNPKIVSEMLGHASIAITLDVYSHVLPDMQQDAAAVMDMVLSKREGGDE